MLSIKIFFFMTLISLACLLPGKKGKMYLVEVESEKKSANSVPGSKFNARPRMQSKALNIDNSKIGGGVVYKFNTSCIYGNGKKVPTGDCNECVCYGGGRKVACTNIDCREQYPPGSCLDYGDRPIENGHRFVPTSKVKSKFVSTSKVKPNEPCHVCLCKDGNHHDCKDCMGGLAGVRVGLWEEGEIRDDCRTCLGLPNTF